MLDTAETTVGEVTETHQWEIPAYNLSAFQAKIAAANRKLERAGLAARFDISYSEFDKPRTGTGPGHNPGGQVFEPWIRATLTGPLRLAHGHYTFAAALVAEEAGVTVHCAPGQELGGYTPAGTSDCDHCKVRRHRTRLYLVRDERDGAVIQLGHSCIELYTGVRPTGLWALTFDEELDELTHGGEGFTHHQLGASVDTVLAYAFAHSNRGRDYQMAGGFGPSTAGNVRTSLFANISRMREQDRRHFAAKAAEAATYLADTALLDAIKAAVRETAEDSDYGRNLRVILAGESVSGRNVGILASLVKVYARALQLEVERRSEPAAAGFLGEVGERIRGIGGTAKTVLYRDGDYGTTTFFVGRTDDGHTLVWSASRELDIEIGDRFTIAAGTVKAHEQYHDVDQTVLTRCAGFEADATCEEKIAS